MLFSASGQEIFAADSWKMKLPHPSALKVLETLLSEAPKNWISAAADWLAQCCSFRCCAKFLVASLLIFLDVAMFRREMDDCKNFSSRCSKKVANEKRGADKMTKLKSKLKFEFQLFQSRLFHNIKRKKKKSEERSRNLASALTVDVVRSDLVQLVNV